MQIADLKSIYAIVAVVLTFVGYAPYFTDIFKGKTKPHLFSWLIWSIVTGIIYALQVTNGAGQGSWVTLAVAFIIFIIFLLSFKKGTKDIRKIDAVFLILSLFALPLWLIIKQPVLSIILLSSIDMLGFVPTIRKSWNDPYSETLSLYVITTFRHMLSFMALAEYNIVTYLFPLSWVVANAAFSILLVVRRKAITLKTN